MVTLSPSSGQRAVGHRRVRGGIYGKSLFDEVIDELYRPSSGQQLWEEEGPIPTLNMSNRLAMRPTLLTETPGLPVTML